MSSNTSIFLAIRNNTWDECQCGKPVFCLLELRIQIKLQALDQLRLTLVRNEKRDKGKKKEYEACNTARSHWREN